MYPAVRVPHADGAHSVHGAHGLHGSVPLPPGQYPYSPALPQIMNALAPSYVIPAEPVFMDHLLMHVDQNVRIQTITGPLVGKLAGVAVDHLQVNVDGVAHHVRFAHITYFAKA